MEGETLSELRLIYEACFHCGLPKSIQKPVNKRGRPGWNRFVLLTVLIYGLINGLSYRRMEEFCRENKDLLQQLDPAWNPKRPPDHKNFHLLAKKLTVADVMRIMAKVRELKGEVPVLWY
jgi:hypothetical protein